MIRVQIAAATWASFAIVRLLYDPRDFYLDLLGIVLAFALVSPKALVVIFHIWELDLGKYGHYIFPGIGYAIASILQYIFKYVSSSKNTPQNEHAKDAKSEGESIIEAPFKPLIFPARTTHTRLFPKQHSFSYSYLLVGTPVGWSGKIGGSFLSVDFERSSRGWFNIQNEDYLHRGRQDTLELKLDQYLKLQGRALSDYAHAYLVTAPKFLGYAFNPVSFWYLYNEQQILIAMILEVNNTFDERRMYFLERTMQSSSKSSVVGEQEIDAKSDTKTLASKWAKDFHVSPFNSRKGSYSLVANDPFSHSTRPPAINNTITLSSSKNHAKLVARIFSTSEAVDPVKLSIIDKARFILSWWWVGFVTFPRIAREAAKLFWKRGLHVWFRPEVMPGSMPRNFTKEERMIEGVFRQWLLELMKGVNEEWLLRYINPEDVAMFTEPGASPDSVMDLKKKSKVFGPNGETDVDRSASCNVIDLRILTPQFYSNLALAGDLEQFFDNTFTRKSNNDAQFISCSDPSVFLDLIQRNKRDHISLRRFFGKNSPHSRKDCRNAFFKVYISEKLFYGTPIHLLSWLEWSCRCCLYVLVAWTCTNFMYLCLLKLNGGVNKEIIIRWISMLEPTFAIKTRLFREEPTTSERRPGMRWLDAFRLILMLCSVHIWWSLKELLRYLVFDR